ncbi:hypothetical protein [Vibrio coralliirubri]|nr:hypothetical protein [Vibrio coralliirubri]
MDKLTINLDVKEAKFSREAVEERLKPLLERLPTAYYQSHAALLRN